MPDASDIAIAAVVTTTSEETECPPCHHCSTRIHSRHIREVADLPWMGCSVHLELHVRRFFCINQECVRRIFTERLPTVVTPYARRTVRLDEVFTLISFALGGSSKAVDVLCRWCGSREQADNGWQGVFVLGSDQFGYYLGIWRGVIEALGEKGQ